MDFALEKDRGLKVIACGDSGYARNDEDRRSARGGGFDICVRRCEATGTAGAEYVAVVDLMKRAGCIRDFVEVLNHRRDTGYIGEQR